MLALELIRPFLERPVAEIPNAARRMSVQYLTLVAEHDPDEVQASTEMIIRAHEGLGLELYHVAAELSSKGHHLASFRMFEHITRHSPEHIGSSIPYMALSWRLGPHDADGKAFILKNVERLPSRAHDEQRVRFLVEDIAEQEYRESAQVPFGICDLHYDLGVLRNAEGKKDEAAKHLLMVLELEYLGCTTAEQAFNVLAAL